MSHKIDILLKHFLKYVKNLINVDLDMLNHLPSKINEGTLLVSLDVLKIYANIPYDYGIEANNFLAWKIPKKKEIPGRINHNFYNHSSSLHPTE